MKARNFALFSVLTTLALFLIIFSKGAKESAYLGFLLSENTILPSLLPLLIIFLTLMNSSANNCIIKIFGLFFKRLFRLPKSAVSAIIFGLIGGYPMGAILTSELYDKGEISSNDAKRIMRFNVCGGCAFIITAVGTSVINDTKSGFILFVSNVFSSLIIGIFSSLFCPKNEDFYESISEPLTFDSALVNATENSIKSILTVTAYIILFSAFFGVLKIPNYITPIFEITNGLCKTTRFTLEVTSAFLSFGGLCIHLQLYGIIKKFKMKYLDFFLFRIIGAVLSFFITKAILLVFPQNETVFSNITSPVGKMSVANTALSVLLIFGCVVLVYDIYSKKKTV